MNGSEKSPKSVGPAAANSSASTTGSGAESAVAETGVATQRFDELRLRLRGVVDKLETGNLPLEDSLKFFEEGIDLCRKGASILDSAERKVEVLLNGSGEAPRTAPFETPSNDGD